MTPNFPTTRRSPRRKTRRINYLTNKENTKTRRPDAPAAPMCAYSQHSNAIPCVRSSHVTGGRARVGPSGARSRAGLRLSGCASGRASGVGSVLVRARLHSLLLTCEKRKGASHERTADCASLAPSIVGRLAMGAAALLAAPGQRRLPSGGLDIPAGVLGRSVAVERLLVSRKSLREAMPTTAAFIDAMRDTFGADMINAAIRAGLDGQPTFWARENGHEVGTRAIVDPAWVVSAVDINLGPISPANTPKPKGKR